MEPQHVRQGAAQRTSALWCGPNISVAQKREDGLTPLQPSRSLAQRGMLCLLCKGEERRHQRIPLLASVALRYVMLGSSRVEQRVDAGAAIKLAGKRQEWGEGRAGPEALEHGLARHVVVPTASTDSTVARASRAVGRVKE